MCPARTDRRSTSRIEQWRRARSSASNVVAGRVGLMPATQSNFVAQHVADPSDSSLIYQGRLDRLASSDPSGKLGT